MPSSSINPFDSSELIPPSQSQAQPGIGLSQKMNVSRYSTFGAIIRIGGRNLEKSSVLSERSDNTETPPKSGKIAAIPRPSAVAGIKRIADAPGTLFSAVVSSCH